MSNNKRPRLETLLAEAREILAAGIRGEEIGTGLHKVLDSIRFFEFSVDLDSVKPRRITDGTEAMSHVQGLSDEEMMVREVLYRGIESYACGFPDTLSVMGKVSQILNDGAACDRVLSNLGYVGGPGIKGPPGDEG
ncbi:MAG: hypothetical protein OXG15_06115 [Gammaproteobacteria bacterium]|nr:hypothetical protein [Gammaproteobacteria bacterium]